MRSRIGVKKIAIGMDCVGKTYEIRHPRSGERYQLTVDKVEQQTLDSEFIEQIGKGLRNQKKYGYCISKPISFGRVSSFS